MTREERINRVKIALLSMLRYPWEQGVTSQAALELGDFELTYLLARDAVQRQSKEGRLGAAFYRDDVAIFGDDITVTDPASNGEAVQLIGKQHEDDWFLDAAEKQLKWLLHLAPKTHDGILCHVINKKQVWIDSIFMALPFMVIMGKYEEALLQLNGFIKYLWNKEKMLFSHIWDEEQNKFAAEDFWGVGNGWAAAGMAKMIRNMPDEEKNSKEQIAAQVLLLLEGCFAHQTEEKLFYNIIDDHSTFVETNLPQMLSYTIYSGATGGWLDKKWVIEADLIREAVYKKIDNHGLVHGVCGSPTFAESGIAAEGQAFFLLMEAAAFQFHENEMEKEG